MKYLVSDVESWGKDLDAMPAPDPGSRKVGKKEAVVLLAKKLQAAARRGFSTAELLDVLASKGLRVHVDTVRAALKLAGKGPLTSPRRGQRNAAATTGRPVETGSEAEPTSARSNAGESDGAQPVGGAEGGPDFELTPARGVVGVSAQSDPETDTEDGRSNSGRSDGGKSAATADIGAERALSSDRSGDGEVADAEPVRDTVPDPAQAAGSERTDVENEADGSALELAMIERDAPGLMPLVATAAGQRRAVPASREVPGRDVEATGKSASPPARVPPGGREASSVKGPERRAAPLAPARGSFTPREDSDEI
jgi:hypothetical protein